MDLLGVVDVGVANLRSVANALNHLGLETFMCGGTGVVGQLA